MKKIAYILGAVVLTAGSVSAMSSFADASTQAALAQSLVNAAKSTEAADRAKGVTDDSKIIADIAAAAAAQAQGAIDAGTSNADINAAMNQAMNTAGLTTDQAQGLGAANGELASLESSRPGGVATGTGGGGGNVTPPAPPPPAAAGAGYVG
jgi:hypothetical protein